MSIQDAIARSFIQLKCNSIDCAVNNLPNVHMQQYPETINTHNFEVQGLYVGFCTLAALVFICMDTIYYINKEIVQRSKEMMMIMGLPSWLIWLGWFFRTLAYLIIAISIMVGFLKVIVRIFSPYEMMQFENFRPLGINMRCMVRALDIFVRVCHISDNILLHDERLLL